MRGARLSVFAYDRSGCLLSSRRCLMRVVDMSVARDEEARMVAHILNFGDYI